MSFDSQFLRRPELSSSQNAPRECAWVRCGDYRCLAFRDKEDRWRGFYDNKLLPEPVEVLQKV